MSKLLKTEAEARAVLERFKALQLLEDKILGVLFDQQKKLIEDPSKFKSAICGRRSGKSYASASYLLLSCAQNPGSRHLYIALTRQNAKNILWVTLKKLIAEYKIEAEFKEAELKIDFKNKAEIWLVGADTTGVQERLRGVAFKLIVIDEAASFRADLNYLIDDILTPTLLDHDGSLMMIGTPSAACSGPFYDATTGANKMYTCHSWTIRENVSMPHAEAWLANYRQQKGWTDDDPTYLREWCARWVRSEDSLVFKLRDHALIDKSPDDLDYVFGLDLGFDDANAIVVIGYKDKDPRAYIVDEFKKSGQSITAFAETIQNFIHRYDPVAIVADTGGLGKSIVNELNLRHQFNIKPAEKKDKLAAIEMVNADFISGRLKICQRWCPQTIQEMYLCQWDEDRKMMDERCENHLSDAVLYAHREAKHWTNEFEKIPLPIDPNEEVEDFWQKKAQELMDEEAEKQWL